MRVEKLEIVFDPLPPEQLTRFVTESLASFNVAATGLSAWYPVGFFLKSRSGEWLGGLLGNIWGGWLHVTHLWGRLGRAQATARHAADAGRRGLRRRARLHRRDFGNNQLRGAPIL